MVATSENPAQLERRLFLWLTEQLYPVPLTCPVCGKIAYPISRRPKALVCRGYPDEAHQFHPLATTVFSKSTTPLSSWFYAIYLVKTEDVSAKQLERELGVTYKTAWRMKKQIKQFMLDNPTLTYEICLKISVKPNIPTP